MREENFFASFIKGVIFSFLLSIILFYILGIILTSSNIPEKIITPAILVITGISILISTSIVMIKNNEKGLIKRRSSRSHLLCCIISNIKYSNA